MAFQIYGLQKRYGEKMVLDVESLEISEGQLFSIVGPSGAGKSTLLRILHLLEKPTEGELDFRGSRVSFPAAVNLRRQISMVFQRPEVLDGTVLQNVQYPLKVRGMDHNGKVEGILKHLDLFNLANQHAADLSGGELQRLALARALVVEPRVLLLDEPTANLDPYNVELIEMIIEEYHKQGTTVVLVTHNVFQARRIAQHVGLMLNGRLVEVSPKEEFFNSPNDPRAKAFVRGEMVY